MLAFTEGLAFTVILMVAILRVLQASCPPGWLTWQDSCYILLPEKMNWFNASKACDQPGVSLLLPNSMEEDQFLWKTMKLWMEEFGASRIDDFNLWIDCVRSDLGKFQCIGDGEVADFRNWADNQPKNRLSGEDCVRMAEFSDGRWRQIRCSAIYFAACEMSKCRRPNSRYHNVPQQCLLNHQIKSYPVKESIGCGLACWAEPLCRSFNLWKQADNKKICQLNYASRKEANITDITYEENCYLYEP